MNVNPMHAGQGKTEELGQAESEGFGFAFPALKNCSEADYIKKRALKWRYN